MNNRPHTRRRNPRAYTLIEALLMIVILSIITIPVGNALVAAGRNTAGNENVLAIDNALASQMETLRATYKTLPTGPSSSTISIGGQSYTVNIDIEPDQPNSTVGYQATFLSLSVTIAGHTLSTKVSNT
ncbi:MAG: type II secretion system protein [Phycisphaerae bacterium]